MNGPEGSRENLAPGKGRASSQETVVMDPGNLIASSPGRQILNHWTTREAPRATFKFYFTIYLCY